MLVELLVRQHTQAVLLAAALNPFSIQLMCAWDCPNRGAEPSPGSNFKRLALGDRSVFKLGCELRSRKVQSSDLFTRTPFLQ